MFCRSIDLAAGASSSRLLFYANYRRVALPLLPSPSPSPSPWPPKQSDGSVQMWPTFLDPLSFSMNHSNGCLNVVAPTQMMTKFLGSCAFPVYGSDWKRMETCCQECAPLNKGACCLADQIRQLTTKANVVWLLLLLLLFLFLVSSLDLQIAIFWAKCRPSVGPAPATRMPAYFGPIILGPRLLLGRPEVTQIMRRLKSIVVVALQGNENKTATNWSVEETNRNKKRKPDVNQPL